MSSGQTYFGSMKNLLTVPEVMNLNFVKPPTIQYLDKISLL